MPKKFHKAFTMLELTFVIVVIGILAAVAIPRFSDTADEAYISEAQSTVAAVRSALATERQKRILRGDNTAITDLSLSSTGGATANAFDHFSGDGQNPRQYAQVLSYPKRACVGPQQRACWTTGAGVGGADKMYSYRFPKAADGTADFELRNNRFDCTAADTVDCRRITQ